jgi:hypothetical protein
MFCPPNTVLPAFHHTSLLFSLLIPLLLEGERGGEYSEARLASLRAVVEKFVA